MQTMKRKLNKRNLVLLLSLALLLTATVGATLAYVITKTDLLTNLFLPSKVDCAVVEDTATGTFSVKNTGDTACYIRIAIVATWTADGKILAEQPDCTVDLTGTNWTKGSDGYYYYKAEIPAGETVPGPKVTAETKENYALSVEILASAIQATPDAVQAWSNGVAAVNGDSLNVKTATP